MKASAWLVPAVAAAVVAVVFVAQGGSREDGGAPPAGAEAFGEARSPDEDLFLAQAGRAPREPRVPQRGTRSRAATQPFWVEGSGKAPLVQVPSFGSLAAELIPTVVSIQVEQRLSEGERPDQGSPGSPFDPFEFFFRGHPAIPREFSRGLGSGFFIHPDGLILTNAHVVEDADVIEVTIRNGAGQQRSVRAKVLGVAAVYDVALIQTAEKMNVPIAPLGDSDAVQIGDWVMAIGNPFGLSHSASVGIISAKDRRDVMPSGREGVYDFLQTDASINPGNSGGPLVNVRGEVIGVNAAINAAGQGIGFATPINLIKAILPDLKEKGRFERSWIGVQIQALTPELAQSYGLDESRGALVAQVVPEGPAAKAGLREGDIILEFDGKPVQSSSDLPLYASMAGVGKEVPLVVLRDGQRQTLAIRLGAFPRSRSREEVESTPEGRGERIGPIGLAITDLTPELRERLGAEVRRGAVITHVAPASPAASAGLRPGDVVVQMGGQDVSGAADLVQRLEAAKPGEVVRLQLVREGTRFFVALKIPVNK